MMTVGGVGVKWSKIYLLTVLTTNHTLERISPNNWPDNYLLSSLQSHAHTGQQQLSNINFRNAISNIWREIHKYSDIFDLHPICL